MPDPSSNNSGKILFIHGFGSCGHGNKAELLRQHYGAGRLLSPDLPTEPQRSIEILKKIIEDENPAMTISSSLGSYYATWLNRQQPIPAVLINPAVNAAEILAPYTGTHQHWCTQELFELTDSHIQQLRQMQRSCLNSDERYLVLLQDKDEILNYQDAVRFYQGNQVIVEQGGNHRFENLHEYLTMIDLFMEQAST